MPTNWQIHRNEKNTFNSFVSDCKMMRDIVKYSNVQCNNHFFPLSIEAFAHMQSAVGPMPIFTIISQFELRFLWLMIVCCFVLISIHKQSPRLDRYPLTKLSCNIIIYNVKSINVNGSHWFSNILWCVHIHTDVCICVFVFVFRFLFLSHYFHNLSSPIDQFY